MQPIWAVRGELDSQNLHQSKADRRLPYTSQYKVLLYLPPFVRNFTFKNLSLARVCLGSVYDQNVVQMAVELSTKLLFLLNTYP